ncbi:thioesterase [Pseudomonas syringae pv. pisi str. 1704B]|uniref:Thioesterase n=1 Tax=Pseudomonas syringae pv. pisi str. 1704B TaxID=629263 RepID=F3GI02_PSESJ|nr:thioesterase [Pseudomonas syringae pv. pisi str. 1704B]
MRMDEPLQTDIVQLANHLADEISAELDKPYALFGHSLGGLLAFELAHALRERGLPAPLALFASATAGPVRRDVSEYATAKTDAQLLDRLRTLKGTSENVIANQELMQLTLPILRADFLLCGSFVVWQARAAQRADPCIWRQAGQHQRRAAARLAGGDLHRLLSGHVRGSSLLSGRRANAAAPSAAALLRTAPDPLAQQRVTANEPGRRLTLFAPRAASLQGARLF